MEQGVQVLLLVGGNRGDVVTTCGKAIGLLAERVGTVMAISRDHWTEPWGFQDDTLFLNKAVLMRVHSTPGELLDTVLGIEHELGRHRAVGIGYAPRTIDIDILLFDGTISEDARLTVPHPRMHLRHFALAPAADVAPSMMHPTIGRTVLQLLNDLRTS